MKRIRIVSPAKSIDKRKIDFAAGFLRSKGYEVQVSSHATGQYHYFSGSDEERLADMQDALDDPTVNVILCSRGGYGSVRIIDRLNFSKFLRYPKMILGYSDVTVFHNRLNWMGYSSAHTTAPLNFEENTPQALESLINVIEEKANEYQIPAYSLNRPGDAKADVVGGNLAIIASLIGTNDELNTKGKILFIEDTGEAIYQVDRMMWTLKKSGKLKVLDGLLIGAMSEMKDSEVPFGKSVDEVIRSAVEEYDYPICFNFPAGHIDDNRALVLGKKAKLSVLKTGAIFSQ